MPLMLVRRRMHLRRIALALSVILGTVSRCVLVLLRSRSRRRLWARLLVRLQSRVILLREPSRRLVKALALVALAVPQERAVARLLAVALLLVWAVRGVVLVVRLLVLAAVGLVRVMSRTSLVVVPASQLAT
ncbi:hypothetical protein [Variovorax gossypii]|uniref:hypothetical protein n=1 Tax=Variovorax gossypii TaxID=1679495 RepID=UPI0019802AB7|nr:hypothetical protein [Variovorax gossypii]